MSLAHALSLLVVTTAYKPTPRTIYIQRATTRFDPHLRHPSAAQAVTLTHCCALLVAVKCPLLIKRRMHVGLSAFIVKTKDSTTPLLHAPLSQTQQNVSAISVPRTQSRAHCYTHNLHYQQLGTDCTEGIGLEPSKFSQCLFNPDNKELKTIYNARLQ